MAARVDLGKESGGASKTNTGGVRLRTVPSTAVLFGRAAYVLAFGLRSLSWSLE